MAVLRVLATIVAVLATSFIVDAASEAGGWTKFSVGLVIGVTLGTYIRHELRADQQRRTP